MYVPKPAWLELYEAEFNLVLKTQGCEHNIAPRSWKDFPETNHISTTSI